MNLTLAYNSTESDRTEAAKVKSVEELEVHTSAVGVIKTCAIVEARVRRTRICNHQLCEKETSTIFF